MKSPHMTTDEELCKSLGRAAGILTYFLSSCQVWPDGTVLETRQLVDRVKNVSIYVYSNDHSPPHFHVKYSGMTASYRIQDCELMVGTLGHKEDKIVKYWFDGIGKQRLIKVWNETRPGDCTVGRYEDIPTPR